MAVTVPRYQRQRTQRVTNPVPAVAPETSAEGLGRGLQEVSDTFAVWQDEVDTAEAKQADARYADLIREELYSDQSGFMYENGENAISRRETVAERIQRAQKEMLEGMRPSVRAKARQSLEARRLRAIESIDRHAAGERQSYLDSAAEARISSTINDAIKDPDLVGQSISIVSQETRDLAERNGWAPEFTDQKLAEARTRVHSGVIARIATADPIMAMDYLADHKDDMTGEEVARLEAELAPVVRERRGRAVGSSAYERDSVSQPAQAALAALEAETGMSFNITSAYRSPEENARVGGADNSQHMHGNAFDIDVSGMTIEERTQLIRKAREMGFGGVGVYDNSLHFDVGPTRAWGPSYGNESVPAWAREAVDAPRGETPDLGQGRTGFDEILEIEDPTERDAALREYELRQGVDAAQREARRSAAADAAFRLIEGGGNIDDLSLEHRQNIGREAMSSLRSYQKKIADGTPIQTDDAFYVQLHDQMATDRNAFMGADPMTWRDKLSDEDFEYFVKARSEMREGTFSAGRQAAQEVSISSIRTASKTALAAAGIDDEEKITSFESRMIRWETAFAEKEGRLPNASERQEKIGQLLTPIVLDPPGALLTAGRANAQDGRYFEIDLDGEPMDPEDDITIDVLRESTLKVNGQPVSDALMGEIAQLFETRYGRAPTVREFLDMATGSGLFN